MREAELLATAQPHFELTCVNRRARLHCTYPRRIIVASEMLLHRGGGIHSSFCRYQRSLRLVSGADTASAFVWLIVSIAVLVVFAFSWPATIVSIDRKQWSRTFMAAIALILTGCYSVSAALGSAMGGRMSTAIEEQDAKDRKAKAQAKWDAAKSELDRLNAAKPGAELQPLIDAAKAELAKLPATRSIAELEALIKRGCPVRTALNGQAKAVCPKYDVDGQGLGEVALDQPDHRADAESARPSRRAPSSGKRPRLS